MCSVRYRFLPPVIFAPPLFPPLEPLPVDEPLVELPEPELLLLRKKSLPLLLLLLLLLRQNPELLPD